MADEQLLRPRDVAAIFNVDINTVARWVREGRIKVSLRTAGGHARFSLYEILRLKLSRQQSDKASAAASPAPPSTVEELAALYSDVIWKPLRQAYKRPVSRANDELRKTRLLEFKGHLDRLDDDHIFALLNITRKELYERIQATSLEQVAVSFNISPDVFRRFCESYRVPYQA